MAHRTENDPLEHININHSDDLLAAVRTFAGYPRATSARARRVDPAGIDVEVDTPDGPATAHLEFFKPVRGASFEGGLRAAFADLGRRAHRALANGEGT